MDDQVTLTAYADEVRELIRHDRADEAIAICKHILHHFPKYIDAYLQMGEAFLGKGDYESAKDLFRRVISADPENVIAHLGLANVFEQQYVANEALWHMERAYELAPGNPDLQKELVRLYNTVDIKAHLRAKLTHGALARVYAQEGLFGQAVQEFRTIIAGMPSRFDIRVALAETLWRIGRMGEATQVAQSILGQLPYCLKANLILGAAWKEAGLPDSDVYLQRAQSLDPTNQTATQILGARSPLPALQVSVPRYVEGLAEAVAPASGFGPFESAPSAELSTTLAEPTVSTAEPNWLESLTEAPATEAPTISEASIKPAPPAITETQLPPWLRTPSESAQVSDETATQPSSWFETPAEVAPETTEETQLPSWLQAEGTLPVVAQVAEPAIIEPAEELPAWLSQLRPPAAEPPAEPVAPVDQTTDWPKELEPTEPISPVIESTQEPTLSVEEQPAWLQELKPAGPVPTAIDESEDIEITSVADLEALFKREQAETTQEQPLAPAEEIQVSSAKELALFKEEEATPVQEPPLDQQPGGRALPPEEELPPWLQGFEELGYRRTQELASDVKPETVEPPLTEETPAWLSRLDETPASTETPVVQVQPSAEETLPSELPSWIVQPSKPVEETAPQELSAELTPSEKPAAPVIDEEPVLTWGGDLRARIQAATEAAREEEGVVPIEPSSPPIVEVPSTPPPPKRKRQPKGYGRLIQARAHRDANRLADALAEYDYLVQHAPRLVNDIIDDLEILTQRINAPLDAHRILGDAYTRADRLAEALERYRFVLEHVS